MSKKIKNTISKIQEISDKIDIKKTSIIWNDIDIEVNVSLMSYDCIKFAKAASESCFSEDGDYIPEMLKFAIGYATVITYTNMDMPESFNDKYKIIMYTDIVENVVNSIDKEQYEYLIQAVDERIDYKLNANIDSVNKQIDALYYKAEDLFVKFSDMFSGIDIEEFKSIMSSLSGMKLDESKLMEAYMTYKK